MRKIFDRALTAALVLVLIVALGSMITKRLEYRREERNYAQAQEIAKMPELPAIPARRVPAVSEEASGCPDEVLTALAEVDLRALREVNEDVTGWICIPETDLSYPLLQGSDNTYYLSHSWQKEKNVAGAVFLDYRSGLDDLYSLIYAHRMSNTTMFGSLKFYDDEAYWAEHPSVYLVSADAVARYDIFSAFEASVYSDVYKLDFTEEERGPFLAWCLEQSVIDTGITPEAAEKIICLSTCTSGGSETGTRWVVHAVLREEAAIAGRA